MTTNRTMTTNMNMNETAGMEGLLRQPDARTAWETCRRGDWMLYQLGATRQVSRQRLVACACECARLALRYAQAGDDRSRIAIETAEAWCRGGGTKQLRAARSDALAAAHDAADAALAATYAARAAAAAADAATFAADAATFAAAAAAAAAAADALAATYAAAAAATNAAAEAAYNAATNAATNAAAYAAHAAAAAAGSEDVLAQCAKLRVLAQCADIVRAHFAFEDLVGN